MKYIIIGYGNIGHKREAILGKSCVATVDTNPNVFPTYKNIKDIPLEIFDAAILTVPQQNKFEIAEFFLAHGKHVLIEKPLIMTFEQGKKLSALARKNKAVWYTSYNHRFEPNIAKIKNFLDRNMIGNIYHSRFVYSFGNIKEMLGTWRETEFGVLEEIVPHQIDFAFNFFGYRGDDFQTLIARKVESKIFDHWMVATTDRRLIIECGAVTWKNVFTIEIYGEKGSIHMNGLRKWGGSELVIRKRILPSGVPKEKKLFNSGPDVTWKQDFSYFNKLVNKKTTTLENDLQVRIALEKL